MDNSPVQRVALVDSSGVPTRGRATNGTASALIKSGGGDFHGFVVNSHSSGTLKFWDNTAGSGTVLLNTITLAAGPSVWVLPGPISFGTGLYVTVGGTIDYTIVWS